MTADTESRLRVEPNALALREIGPWLLRATAGRDPDLVAACARAELAIHEACMNVIDHANPPPGSMIDLCLAVDARQVRVVIRDGGVAFDPEALPPPTSPGLGERGNGLTIIRSLVNELVYRRLDGVNEWELRIDLGSSHG